MTNETDYTTAQRYNVITQEFTKYAGISLYFLCIFGTIMNILTFLQKTYNRRACSLYLLFASVFDLAHLSPGTLSTILQYGFYYDWTINYVAYCKIKNYLIYVLTMISGTFTVFASIDRYFLSSHNSNLWNYSSRLVAKCCIKFIIIFWFIASFPIIYCSKHVNDSLNNQQTVCSNPADDKFCLSIRIVYTCLLDGFLPPLIMMIFGLLTYNNIRHLVQRSNAKSMLSQRIHHQITTMLILQSVKSTFTSFPVSIFNSYRLKTTNMNKTLTYQAKESLVKQIVYLLFWSNYTSFFVYIYSSDIFRKQWILAMKNCICCRCGNKQQHDSDRMELKRLRTTETLKSEKLTKKKSSL
jgi:hypothetical protein